MFWLNFWVISPLLFFMVRPVG